MYTSTLFDKRKKNEDLEGNHCVIVFAAADLLRPLAAKLWFSLLGDTTLVSADKGDQKSQQTQKQGNWREIAPNYTLLSYCR